MFALDINANTVASYLSGINFAIYENMFKYNIVFTMLFNTLICINSNIKSDIPIYKFNLTANM